MSRSEIRTASTLRSLTTSRVATLVLGIAIGALSTRLGALGGGDDAGPPIRAVQPAAPVAPSAPAGEKDAPTRPVVAEAAGPEEPEAASPQGIPALEVDSSEELAAFTHALQTRLQQESAARRRLASEVEKMRTALAALGRDLDDLASKQEAYDLRSSRWRRRPQVSPQTLVEAGYSEAEAVRLAEQWGEQEMSELYLRDQARREGWMGTDRYRAALADARSGPGSLRGALGDEEYDALLYSIGQSNRLLVESVVESSPAQSAGLLPGDVIRGYDGARVFSWSDLRAGIGSGEPDFPVTVEIERDGQIYDVEIPRGPLGVRLDSQSLPPQ